MTARRTLRSARSAWGGPGMLGTGRQGGVPEEEASKPRPEGQGGRVEGSRPGGSQTWDLPEGPECQMLLQVHRSPSDAQRHPLVPDPPGNAQPG